MPLTYNYEMKIYHHHQQQQKQRPQSANDVAKKDKNRGSLMEFFDPVLNEKLYGKKKPPVVEEVDRSKQQIITMVNGTMKVNAKILQEECEKDFESTWFLESFNDNMRSLIVNKQRLFDQPPPKNPLNKLNLAAEVAATIAAHTKRVTDTEVLSEESDDNGSTDSSHHSIFNGNSKNDASFVPFQESLANTKAGKRLLNSSPTRSLPIFSTLHSTNTPKPTESTLSPDIILFTECLTKSILPYGTERFNSKYKPKNPDIEKRGQPITDPVLLAKLGEFGYPETTSDDPFHTPQAPWLKYEQYMTIKDNQILHLNFTNYGLGPNGGICLSKALEYCPMLITFKLANNRLDDVSGAMLCTQLFQQCKQCIYLDLSRNHIQKQAIQVLCTHFHPSLSSSTSQTTTSAGTAETVSSQKKAHLQHTMSTAKFPPSVNTTPPTAARPNMLQYLNLNHCALGDELVSQLMQSISDNVTQNRLESLYLRGNGIGKLDDEKYALSWIECLLSHTYLTSLDLAENFLKHQYILLLFQAMSGHLAPIVLPTLSSNNADFKESKKVKYVPLHPSMTFQDSSSSNTNTNTNLGAIKDPSTCAPIKNFNLSYNQLTDEDIMSCSIYLEQLVFLQKIDLSYNRMSSKGCMVVMFAATCASNTFDIPSLQWMNLLGNPVSEVAWKFAVMMMKYITQKQELKKLAKEKHDKEIVLHKLNPNAIGKETDQSTNNNQSSFGRQNSISGSMKLATINTNAFANLQHEMNLRNQKEDHANPHLQTNLSPLKGILLTTKPATIPEPPPVSIPYFLHILVEPSILPSSEDYKFLPLVCLSNRYEFDLTKPYEYYMARIYCFYIQQNPLAKWKEMKWYNKKQRLWEATVWPPPSTSTENTIHSRQSEKNEKDIPALKTFPMNELRDYLLELSVLLSKHQQEFLIPTVALASSAITSGAAGGFTTLGGTSVKATGSILPKRNSLQIHYMQQQQEQIYKQQVEVEKMRVIELLRQILKMFSFHLSKDSLLAITERWKNYLQYQELMNTMVDDPTNLDNLPQDTHFMSAVHGTTGGGGGGNEDAPGTQEEAILRRRFHTLPQIKPFSLMRILLTWIYEYFFYSKEINARRLKVFNHELFAFQEQRLPVHPPPPPAGISTQLPATVLNDEEAAAKKRKERLVGSPNKKRPTSPQKPVMASNKPPSSMKPKPPSYASSHYTFISVYEQCLRMISESNFQDDTADLYVDMVQFVQSVLLSGLQHFITSPTAMQSFAFSSWKFLPEGKLVIDIEMPMICHLQTSLFPTDGFHYFVKYYTTLSSTIESIHAKEDENMEMFEDKVERDDENDDNAEEEQSDEEEEMTDLTKLAYHQEQSQSELLQLMKEEAEEEADVKEKQQQELTNYRTRRRTAIVKRNSFLSSSNNKYVPRRQSNKSNELQYTKPTTLTSLIPKNLLHRLNAQYARFITLMSYYLDQSYSNYIDPNASSNIANPVAAVEAQENMFYCQSYCAFTYEQAEWIYKLYLFLKVDVSLILIEKLLYHIPIGYHMQTFLKRNCYFHEIIYLKKKLPYLMDIFLGHVTRHYRLNLALQYHRYILWRLMEYNHYEKAYLQTFTSFNGSQSGDFSHFRNVTFNAQPLPLTNQWIERLPSKGTLSFDYSSCISIIQNKLLACNMNTTYMHTTSSPKNARKTVIVVPGNTNTVSVSAKKVSPPTLVVPSQPPQPAMSPQDLIRREIFVKTIIHQLVFENKELLDRIEQWTPHLKAPIKHHLIQEQFLNQSSAISQTSLLLAAAASMMHQSMALGGEGGSEGGNSNRRGSMTPATPTRLLSAHARRDSYSFLRNPWMKEFQKYLSSPQPPNLGSASMQLGDTNTLHILQPPPQSPMSTAAAATTPKNKTRLARHMTNSASMQPTASRASMDFQEDGGENMMMKLPGLKISDELVEEDRGEIQPHPQRHDSMLSAFASASSDAGSSYASTSSAAGEEGEEEGEEHNNKEDPKEVKEEEKKEKPAPPMKKTFRQITKEYFEEESRKERERIQKVKHAEIVEKLASKPFLLRVNTTYTNPTSSSMMIGQESNDFSTNTSANTSEKIPTIHTIPPPISTSKSIVSAKKISSSLMSGYMAPGNRSTSIQAPSTTAPSTITMSTSTDAKIKQLRELEELMMTSLPVAEKNVIDHKKDDYSAPLDAFYYPKSRLCWQDLCKTSLEYQSAGNIASLMLQRDRKRSMVALLKKQPSAKSLTINDGIAAGMSSKKAVDFEDSAITGGEDGSQANTAGKSPLKASLKVQFQKDVQTHVIPNNTINLSVNTSHTLPGISTTTSPTPTMASSSSTTPKPKKDEIDRMVVDCLQFEKHIFILETLLVYNVRLEAAQVRMILERFQKQKAPFFILLRIILLLWQYTIDIEFLPKHIQLLPNHGQLLWKECMYRIGYLKFWSPLYPEGEYELQLQIYEQRELFVRIIALVCQDSSLSVDNCQLQASLKSTNRKLFDIYKFKSIFSVQNIFLESIPKTGIMYLTLSSKITPITEEIMQFRKTCMQGHELCKLLYMLQPILI